MRQYEHKLKFLLAPSVFFFQMLPVFSSVYMACLFSAYSSAKLPLSSILNLNVCVMQTNSR
jgi:hypothetical protein